MELAGKRILLVHSSAELYGSDRCLAWIAADLRERGAEIDAVLPFSGPLENELEKMGAYVHLIDPIVFRRSIMRPTPIIKMAAIAVPSIMRICRLIKRNNIDLIHSNTGVVVGGAIAARLCGVPHIWHFREVLTEFKQLWFLHEQLVSWTTREIVCISNAVASQFVNSKAKRKISIIYDGIPIPDALPASLSQKPGQGSVRLLSVGRLAPYKGQDVLIMAMRELLDRGLNPHLTLVGDVFGEMGDYRKGLKKQVAELGLGQLVDFAGFCPDVDPFYEQADIFILPSRRPEGLGLVVLEAMAHGMPVVATRGGGIMEVIEDRVNGLLVEPGNHIALADAIAEMAADRQLAQSIGASGLKTVKESFSLQGMISNLSKVYNRVLSQA